MVFVGNQEKLSVSSDHDRKTNLHSHFYTLFCMVKL
jgi:hypothetical protein